MVSSIGSGKQISSYSRHRDTLPTGIAHGAVTMKAKVCILIDFKTKNQHLEFTNTIKEVWFGGGIKMSIDIRTKISKDPKSKKCYALRLPNFPQLDITIRAAAVGAGTPRPALFVLRVGKHQQMGPDLYTYKHLKSVYGMGIWATFFGCLIELICR